jgi:pyruvoyl-dependent arginine decarboxylase
LTVGAKESKSLLPSGLEPIKGQGLLIPTIYEAITSKEVGQRISAAVGIGITIPATKGAGIIFTYSCVGSKKEAEKTVREMVAEGMRAKGYFKHRCEISAASAIVERDWTCAMASAVFCDKDLERFFHSAQPIDLPKSISKKKASSKRKGSPKSHNRSTVTRMQG